MSSNDDLAVASVSTGGNGGGNFMPKANIQVRVDNGVEDLDVSNKDAVVIHATILSNALASKGDSFSAGKRAKFKITDKKKIEDLGKYLTKPDELKTTFEKGAILTMEACEVKGDGIVARFASFFSSPECQVQANTGAKIMDKVPLIDRFFRVGRAGDKRQSVTMYDTEASIALSGPEGAKSDVAARLATLAANAKVYLETCPEHEKEFIETWLEGAEQFDQLSALDQVETIVDGFRFDPEFTGLVPNSQYTVALRAVDSQAADPAQPNAILAAEFYQGSMAYKDPNDETKTRFRQMTFSEMVEHALNSQLRRKLERDPSPEERINYADMVGGNVAASVAKLGTEVTQGDKQVVTFGSKNLDQLIKFLSFLDNTAMANESNRVWEVIPCLQMGIMGDSLKSGVNVANTRAWRPLKKPFQHNGEMKQFSDSIIARGSALAIAFFRKQTGYDDSYMVSKALMNTAFVNAKKEVANPTGQSFMIDELPTHVTGNLGFNQALEKVGDKRTYETYNPFNWDKDTSKEAENDNKGPEGNEHSAPPAPGQ